MKNKISSPIFHEETLLVVTLGLGGSSFEKAVSLSDLLTPTIKKEYYLQNQILIKVLF